MFGPASVMSESRYPALWKLSRSESQKVVRGIWYLVSQWDRWSVSFLFDPIPTGGNLAIWGPPPCLLRDDHPRSEKTRRSSSATPQRGARDEESDAEALTSGRTGRSRNGATPLVSPSKGGFSFKKPHGLQLWVSGLGTCKKRLQQVT